MRRFFVLHARMQQFLKVWSGIDRRSYERGSTSVVQAEWLRRLQAELGNDHMDDAALRARLQTNFATLEAFASALHQMAIDGHPGRPELTRFLPAHSGGAPAVDIDSLRVAAVFVTGASLNAG